MPDHKNFVSDMVENAFSPCQTMVFRIAAIYSHTEPRVGLLLIFSRSAQINPAGGAS